MIKEKIKYIANVAKIHITKRGLDKKNALFHLLPNAKKRVSIAWDTIMQLNTEAIIAITGKYVDRYNINLEKIEAAAANDLLSYDARKLQEGLINIKLNNCQVCALGGMFLSSIRIGNNCSTSIGVGARESNVYTQLEKYFSIKQLALIEFTFENSEVCSRMITTSRFRDNITVEEELAINTFKRRYNNNDNARLRAIMNNIIKNKGEFIP